MSRALEPVGIANGRIGKTNKSRIKKKCGKCSKLVGAGLHRSVMETDCGGFTCGSSDTGRREAHGPGLRRSVLKRRVQCPSVSHSHASEGRGGGLPRTCGGPGWEGAGGCVLGSGWLLRGRARVQASLQVGPLRPCSGLRPLFLRSWRLSCDSGLHSCCWFISVVV